MVSQSIDEGLLFRIQAYVATDINRRRAVDILEGKAKTIQPEEVYILSFSRILNNWQAVAGIEDTSVGFYQISHDGSTGQTIAAVYHKETSTEAII